VYLSMADAPSASVAEAVTEAVAEPAPVAAAATEAPADGVRCACWSGKGGVGTDVRPRARWGTRPGGGSGDHDDRGSSGSRRQREEGQEEGRGPGCVGRGKRRRG
jgi:hypothetical protein